MGACKRGDRCAYLHEESKSIPIEKEKAIPKY